MGGFASQAPLQGFASQAPLQGFASQAPLQGFAPVPHWGLQAAPRPTASVE